MPPPEISSSNPATLLVVKDDFLIGALLDDMLQELGYSVLGPADNLDEAMQFAIDAQIDGALLDINLGAGRSTEIADISIARKIPFILLAVISSRRMSGFEEFLFFRSRSRWKRCEWRFLPRVNQSVWRDFLSLAILDLKGSFATYRDETQRASIGHGGTWNKVVFPISHLDQRNGRRTFIPPALGFHGEIDTF